MRLRPLGGGSLDRTASLAHETKFVLRASVAAAARLLLRGALRPESPHAAGVIDTVYFDDARGSALGEKQAGEYHKSKFRLRWYDGAGEVFLECKRRIGTRRSKLRAPVPLAAEELTCKGLAALRGLSLAPFSSALGLPLAAELTPTLHLRYRRARFVGPRGERLSIDSDIEALAAGAALARRPGPVRLPVGVVEVKGSERALPPACAGLAALGARRGSFSKYAACFEALTR